MAQPIEVDTGVDEAELLRELVAEMQATATGVRVDVSQGEITTGMYAAAANMTVKNANYYFQKWRQAGLLEKLNERRVCHVSNRLQVTYRWLKRDNR